MFERLTRRTLAGSERKEAVEKRESPDEIALRRAYNARIEAENTPEVKNLSGNVALAENAHPVPSAGVVNEVAGPLDAAGIRELLTLVQAKRDLPTTANFRHLGEANFERLETFWIKTLDWPQGNTFRRELFAGIPIDFLAGITLGSSPATQLRNDLDALNRARSLPDGTVPMEVFLENIARHVELAEEMPQRAGPFDPRQLFNEIRARTTPVPEPTTVPAVIAQALDVMKNTPDSSGFKQHVSDDVLREVEQLVFDSIPPQDEAGRAALRSRIFEGVPNLFVGSFATFGDLATQLRGDLRQANRTHALVDGTVPLEKMLQNIAGILSEPVTKWDPATTEADGILQHAIDTIEAKSNDEHGSPWAYLSHAELLDLRDELLARLPPRTVNGPERGRLFAGTMAAMGHTVPTTANPSTQIMTDLSRLNEIQRSVEGDVPLQLYLQNAVALFES